MLRPTLRTHRTLFAAVAAAQLLDLVTFLAAVAHVGIGAESNPVARALYSWDGPIGPAVLKATAIAIILIAQARVMRRFPGRAALSAALAVGIGIVGAASNIFFGLLH